MARPTTSAVRLLSGTKEPVRVATTANVDLETGGLLTIDGVVTEPGMRVLVKNQTDATENGVYNASAGEWNRASDSNSTRTLNKGITVHVQEGTLNSSKAYSFQTLDPDVGTDDISIAFYISDDIVGDATEEIQTAVDASVAAAEADIEAAGDTQVARVVAAGDEAWSTSAHASAMDAALSATAAGEAAQLAVTASATLPGVFSTLENGLAASSEGDSFWVYIYGEPVMKLYQNNGGLAFHMASLDVDPGDGFGFDDLIGDYTTYLAFDFTLEGGVEIVRGDAAVPANDFIGGIRDWGTFADDWGSTRFTMQNNGKLRMGAENRFTYSNDFTNAAWTKTTITAAFEPDGTTLLTATAAVAHLGRANGPLGSVGRWRSLYVLAKKDTTDWVFLNPRDASVDGRTWFNLATGVVGTTTAGHRPFIYTQATCPFDDVAIPAGWYLIGVAVKGTIANGTPQIGLADADNSTAVTVGKTAYIQKAQAIAGTHPAPYLDTTTAGITTGLPYDWRNGYRALLIEPFIRNYRGAYSDDLSQAPWVKTNCAAVFNTVSIVDLHGESSSTLTASAADATCLQTTATANVTHHATVWLRRVTGSGAVSMVINGTEQLVTLTSDWQRFTMTWHGASAVAVYGLKLAVSGDAVEVAMLNCMYAAGLTNAQVPVSDIVTDATASVTGSADNVIIPAADMPGGERMYYVDLLSAGGGSNDVMGPAGELRRNSFYYHLFMPGGFSLVLQDWVPGERAEITQRISDARIGASMNGFGAIYDGRAALPADSTLTLGGSDGSPLWLRRMLVAEGTVEDSEVERWRYSGDTHDARYLDDVSISRHLETTDVQSQREPALSVYSDSATTANGLFHWNQEGTVAGVGVHIEQPARIRARTWSVDKTTRRITLGEPFTLSEPAAWATGYGHHQSHVVMKQTVGAETGRIWYVYTQLDSVAGTLSPDWRRIYAAYSDDNLATQSTPAVIHDLGSGTFAGAGPSGNYAEYPAASAYPGRLVFPYYSTGGIKGVIYRDPGGAWTPGATFVDNFSNEPTLALLPNGDLQMTVRHETGGEQLRAVFTDGGETFVAFSVFPPGAVPAWDAITSSSLSQVDPTGSLGSYGKVLIAGARNSQRTGLVIQALTGSPPELTAEYFYPMGQFRYCGYVTSQALSGGLLLVGYETSYIDGTNLLDNIRLMLVDVSEFGGF